MLLSSTWINMTIKPVTILLSHISELKRGKREDLYPGVYRWRHSDIRQAWLLQETWKNSRMGGLEGKCFITTALTFYIQEILLFVYLLNNSDMPFKTVPVIIWRYFFWLEVQWTWAYHDHKPRKISFWEKWCYFCRLYSSEAAPTKIRGSSPDPTAGWLGKPGRLSEWLQPLSAFSHGSGVVVFISTGKDGCWFPKTGPTQDDPRPMHGTGFVLGQRTTPQSQEKRLGIIYSSSHTDTQMGSVSWASYAGFPLSWPLAPCVRVCVSVLGS